MSRLGTRASGRLACPVGRSPARPLTRAGETEATCRWTFFPAYRAAPGEGRRLIGRRIAASTPAATPQRWPRAGRPDWVITTRAPCIVHSRVASPGGATHECTTQSNSGRWGGGPQGQNGKQPSNGLSRQVGGSSPRGSGPRVPLGGGRGCSACLEARCRIHGDPMNRVPMCRRPWR